MVNIIGDEIKEILKQDIGTAISNPETCSKIRAKITNYLTQIQLKLSYPKRPEVRVEHEGAFVTVNFFDDKGNRLETLGDMLEFMENPPM